MHTQSTHTDFGWTSALRALDAGLSAVEELAWGVRRAASAGRGAVEDTTRAVDRARKVGQTVLHAAVAYRFHQTRAAFSSNASADRALQRLHKRQARRFRQRCEELGGAFLKVGQLLSSRPDLVPEPWITELSRLRDAAPHEPWPAIRSAVADLDLATIDEVPVAAASIGQVHRARTAAGDEIALKIQRPDIEQRVVADLTFLKELIRALGEQLPLANPEQVAIEISDAVMEELDYGLEALRMGRCAAYFADVPGVLVPTPLPALSSSIVLAATYEDGVPITDALDRLASARAQGDEEAADEIDRLLDTVFDAWLRMVLDLGLFQADPHPGNLLVNEAGELIILDYGCAADVDLETRAAYGTFLAAMLANDREGMGASLERLGFRTESGRTDTLMEFADLLLGHARDALTGEATWPSGEELLAQAAAATNLAARDPIVHMPDGFVMLARVFGTLGGLFLTYRPRRLGTRTLATLATHLGS